MGGSKVTKVKKKEREKSTQSKYKWIEILSIIIVIMSLVTIFPVIIAPHGLTTHVIRIPFLNTIQCTGNGTKSEKMSEVNFLI